MTGIAWSSADRDRHRSTPSARQTPTNALTPSERRQALRLLNSAEFVDAAAAQIYAALLNQGVYVGSPPGTRCLRRRTGLPLPLTDPVPQGLVTHPKFTSDLVDRPPRRTDQVNRVTLKLFRALRWTPQRGHPFLWTNIQSQGVHISGEGQWAIRDSLERGTVMPGRQPRAALRGHEDGNGGQVPSISPKTRPEPLSPATGRTRGSPQLGVACAFLAVLAIQWGAVLWLACWEGGRSDDGAGPYVPGKGGAVG